nr:F-box/WD-40 repeat-containing protein At3g52030-like isoform X1 [Coffea arabica]
MELSSSGLRPPPQPAAKKKQKTTIHALSHDILCMIFTFLDLVQLIRCSAACKSWSTVINKLKLLEIQYHKQQDADAFSLPEASIQLGRSLNIHMEQIAIEQYRFALHKGPANVFQWKGHSVGVNKCRMKMGLFLTGVGDKMMRLWSAESYNFLDEYSLPDKAPLIDFDFDENKVT